MDRDAGIDQAEQQEHTLHRNSPPALEARQRVIGLGRRVHEQTGITRRPGKKGDDWHQRERRRHPGHEERPPRQHARTEQIGPERPHAALTDDGGQPERHGHERHALRQVCAVGGL